MTANFKFLNLAELPQFEDALLGMVPVGVSDSKVLLRAVADSLSFPSYFGENWDALSDCLRDFHWTEKRSIVLVHEDVPHIPADELRVYLEVLRDAVSDWKAGDPHELVVVFDERCQDAVTGDLKG